MARPGPKPESNIIKAYRGNRGKRPLNDAEPDPPLVKKLPPPPAILGKHGRAEWRHAVKTLTACRVLTEADLTVLRGHCLNEDMLLTAAADLKDTAPYRETFNPNGSLKYIQQHPSVNILLKTLGHQRLFCAELGMTPSSRSRIKVAQAENDEDGTAKFFEKR